MVKKKYFKTKDECIVIFELKAENAEAVSLVGEFNGWRPMEMVKQLKNGPFKTKVRLPKEGSFQFRYLVNEQTWQNDETADSYLTNEYGGQNSVVSTFSKN